jgi:hypothetical protein
LDRRSIASKWDSSDDDEERRKAARRVQVRRVASSESSDDERHSPVSLAAKLLTHRQTSTAAANIPFEHLVEVFDVAIAKFGMSAKSKVHYSYVMQHFKVSPLPCRAERKQLMARLKLVAWVRLLERRPGPNEPRYVRATEHCTFTDEHVLKSDFWNLKPSRFLMASERQLPYRTHNGSVSLALLEYSDALVRQTLTFTETHILLLLLLLLLQDITRRRILPFIIS